MSTAPVREIWPLHVRLDERLMHAVYPLDPHTVEEVLYAHGPEHWNGPRCRACGYVYTANYRDCPSVTVALATARP